IRPSSSVMGRARWRSFSCISSWAAASMQRPSQRGHRAALWTFFTQGPQNPFVHCAQKCSERVWGWFWQRRQGTATVARRARRPGEGTSTAGASLAGAAAVRSGAPGGTPAGGDGTWRAGAEGAAADITTAGGAGAGRGPEAAAVAPETGGARDAPQAAEAAAAPPPATANSV